MKYLKKLFHQLRDKLKVFNLKFLSYMKTNKNFVLIMFIICGILSIGIYISYAYFSDIINRNLFAGSVESFSSPHLNIKYMVEDRDENGVGTGTYTAFWNAPEKDYVYISEKSFCTNGATFVRNSDDTFDVSSPGKTRCEFYYDAIDLTTDSDVKIVVLKEKGETCKSGTCEYEDASDYTIESLINNGYKFIAENSSCEGDSNISFNYVENKLVTNAVGKTECRAYFDYISNTNYEFQYTGNYQKIIIQVTGAYKVEAWGASGGTSYSYGGYVSGVTNFSRGDILYVYVGESGVGKTSTFNNGGVSYTVDVGSGGGATDIRLDNNLESRFIVASAGGQNDYINDEVGGYAGGLTAVTSYNVYYSAYASTGGTQVSGGTVTNYPSSYIGGTPGGFGIGGSGGGGDVVGSSSGGAGYYGGAGGSKLNLGSFPSAGGSSYISGHTGCVAITSSSDRTPKTGCTTGTSNINCSYHYSGYTFTDTVMIDGAGYSWTNVRGSRIQMPKPDGTLYNLGVGHTGDGYLKITALF